MSDYDDFENDVGIDADEDRKHGQANRQEWFKGDKGRTYRAALVYFHTVDVAAVNEAKLLAKKKGANLSEEEIEHIAKEALSKKATALSKKPDELTAIEKMDLNHVRFKRVEAHYKEGVGYCLSRLGKDGDEADAVWKMMGDKKTYFTTVLLFYPCDKDGNLWRTSTGEIDKTRLAGDWHVEPWRLSPKNYDNIWSVNKGLRSNDLNLADQDLILKCENAEFQNFKITGAGKATWKKSPEFIRRVLDRAMPLYEKLIPFREMSSADLRIKLGVQEPNQGQDVSTDFDNMLDNV